MRHLKNYYYQFTHWETWDWRIKYIPLVPLWLRHCIRSGSWWFFTSSNPTLAFGGFEGETKQAIYKHLPTGSYPKSIFISPEEDFPNIQKRIETDFNYPFVAKPNVGRMGYMFRIIYSAAQLQHYHTSMCVDYLVQDLITYPLEVSVFYYRFPGEQKGIITGFVKKENLTVTGDGKSTLLELMRHCINVPFRLKEMESKHRENLNIILKKDDVYALSNALNLSRGGKLISLEHEKDERLLNVFNDLSIYSKTLFFGRYDIKCASIEALKKGQEFSILEYNGCGAEPHHVYGNGNTLVRACMILAKHWNILFKISRYNHKNGAPYYSFKRGWKEMMECRKHFAALKKLDKDFPMFRADK